MSRLSRAARAASMMTFVAWSGGCALEHTLTDGGATRDAGPPFECIVGARCSTAALCEVGTVVGCDPLRCEPIGIESAGTPCRASRGECDFPDLCDGVSASCLDTHELDGTPCLEGAGSCNGGGCWGGERCGLDVHCETGFLCTIGAVDCATFACMVVSNAPAGSRCSLTMACDAAGMCSTPICFSGERCDTGEPCTVGETDCSSGASACVVIGVQPAGTPCDAAGFCDDTGLCVEP